VDDVLITLPRLVEADSVLGWAHRTKVSPDGEDCNKRAEYQELDEPLDGIEHGRESSR